MPITNRKVKVSLAISAIQGDLQLCKDRPETAIQSAGFILKELRPVEAAVRSYKPEIADKLAALVQAVENDPTVITKRSFVRQIDQIGDEITMANMQ